MSKKIIIDASFPSGIRVALLQEHNIEEIEYQTAGKQQNKGNIYLAKVSRIEPSLQAAFIEYGDGRSGFLPFMEISSDYYNTSSLTLNSSILKEIISTNNSNVLDDTNSVLNTLDNNQSEEIIITDIEKLVDEKLDLNLDLDVEETDIETINNDRIKHSAAKNHRINTSLKKGQILLVQVTKEERGNKGASFTTFISLAGRYCVLMPNKEAQNGISRKILAAGERRRLKEIIAKIAPDNASVIARTAAISHSSLEIKRDYDYLVGLWNNIRFCALKSNAPAFIHEEEGIIQKALRDMFSRHVKEIVIQGKKAYSDAIKFIEDIAPLDATKIKEYKFKIPIFTKYNIEKQLSSLYQPTVPLKSGGYVVINPTEALTSVDVNSGKATEAASIEETAFKTNLEAAKEIARQIKLRELSGLIVIDFIDMAEARNRKIIERSFKEFLSRDKARIQVGNISNFGLMEMSRQRLRSSFLESNSVMCNHCSGKGIVRADDSNAMLILRTMENEVYSDDINLVNIYANLSSVLYLLNHKRNEIALIENKYNIIVNLHFDSEATADSFSIEKMKIGQKNVLLNLPLTKTLTKDSAIVNIPSVSSMNVTKQKWRSKDNNVALQSREVTNIDVPILLSSDETAQSGKIDILDNKVDNIEIQAERPKKNYRPKSRRLKRKVTTGDLDAINTP